MHGVLVVDKPAGPTSHDIVDGVRRLLQVRRAGHTGTLDPFATGVLPVCVGKATRLARFLAEGEKVYRATVRLGFATTTDDATGTPIHDARPVSFAAAAVEEAVRSLTGEILQRPPAYSAKRVGGQRLYALARQGLAVEPDPARVTVHAIDLLEVAGDTVEMEVRCSPGTYVRALARDLGDRLGVGGHLASLRRVRSGGFGLDDAVRWEPSPEEARQRLVALSAVLLELPAVAVSAEGHEALRHGRDLDRRLVTRGFPTAAPSRMRVVDGTGALLALAVPRGFDPPGPGLSIEPVLHPDVVLTD
jgi:tRNA pseudouridine55 synthase